jgi:hypothetical protein
MARFKTLAFIALITLAFGVVLVGDALAWERGKVVTRDVNFATGVPSAKVPDVEGHAIHFRRARRMEMAMRYEVGLR